MISDKPTELKPFAPITIGEKLELDIQPDKPMVVKITASNPEDINLLAAAINEDFVIVQTSKIFNSDKLALEDSGVYCYLHVLPLRRRTRQ